MAKNKMKRSGVHKKSERAIEAEKEREEQQKEAEARTEQAKQTRALYKNNILDAMFPLYGLGCAVLSFLFTAFGVFSIGAVIFGILGMKRHAGKKNAYFWLSGVSLVLGVITAIACIMNLGAYLAK